MDKLLIKGVMSVRNESVYAKDLQHELLYAFEEQSLLRQAQAGDELALEKLILCNLKLVRSIVKQYANPNPHVSADDLMADGIIGLHRAISKYDESFGTRLSTYAVLWIHQTVSRSKFLQSTIRLPEDVRQEVWAINRAKLELLKQERPVSVEAISEITKISPERVERLKHLESDVIHVMSFDKHIGKEEGEPLTLMDIVADENAEKAYIQVELEVDLEFFLSKLDAHERFIVERFHGIPIEMTQREIGKVLGYNPNDIYVMLADAMAKLKRLGRALRGSASEQKLALENPQLVMAGELETIPLFDPGDIHMKKRELKSWKRQNETDETDNKTEQLSLFG